MADNTTLAAWLRERTEVVKPPIAKAIYEGLRMRVERGDFDISSAQLERGDEMAERIAP